MLWWVETNELQIDHLLFRSQVVRDRWATNLLGPVSTPQQATNAQFATSLYHCWSRLSKLDGEFPDNVVATIAQSIKVMLPDISTTMPLQRLTSYLQGIRQAFDKIVDPLLLAIQRELSANVARIHKLDLASDATAFSGASSMYMKDLVEKLAFIKGEVLAKFNIGDVVYEWYVSARNT
jgi:hypothetical protein